MRVLHNLFRHDLQEKELFTMDFYRRFFVATLFSI
jgi:hypothetical protein